MTDAPAPEQIRDWLRASATIVKPGETLVIRCPETASTTQVHELARGLEDADLPFRYLLIPPVDLAVAEQAPSDDFATRVAQALAHPVAADALHMALLRGGIRRSPDAP